MKIISLNIGQAQHYLWRDGTESAICKHPVELPLSLTTLGFEGDQQVDRIHHGGEDKAVLVLPADNYAFLKLDCHFGYLGENLTVSGLDESEVCLGDRFHIGSALLEVSQPRSPCWKLGEHGSDVSALSSTDFLQQYAQSGRVGFYCRVLTPGTVQAGYSVRWLTRNASQQSFPAIPIQTLFLAKLFHRTDADWQCLHAALKHPALSVSWREELNALSQRAEQS